MCVHGAVHVCVIYAQVGRYLPVNVAEGQGKMSGGLLCHSAPCFLEVSHTEPGTVLTTGKLHQLSYL